MVGRITGLCCRFGKFGRCQSGTATVESVLWFPIFIVVFGLMVDASMIFNGQAKVLRVVQDANRNMSIGRLKNIEETEAYIETVLASLDIVAEATSTVTAGVVTTNVTLNANQLQILGFFSSLNRLKIGVTADHMIENWEV